MRLVGHRGASALAPENTLPAFAAAIAAGVTMVETDVRLTRDHRLICFHDDRLDRLTAAQGLVSQHDWAELRNHLILPGSFQARFPEARIPLLDEVLRAVPEPCRLCIEIKADPQFPDGAVARKTLECLREANALDRTRIIAFDIEDLRAALRLSRDDPSLSPADFGVLGGRRQLPYWKDWAEELRATTIHFDYRVLLENPSLIEEAHTFGYKVNAWTVNDTESAARMLATGVEEITTDDPGLIQDAISRRFHEQRQP